MARRGRPRSEYEFECTCTYVRPSWRARVHRPAGRPAQRYSITGAARHAAGRIRRGRGKRVLYAALGYRTCPDRPQSFAMLCGGKVRALHAHSTSVRAIRDGAACRRGVGKPEARGPRLSPVRLRLDLWSAPYHVYAVWVRLTRPFHHTYTHVLIPRRRDLSLHAGAPAAPGLDTRGRTVAEPTTRAHHLSVVAAVGHMARRPPGPSRRGVRTVRHGRNRAGLPHWIRLRHTPLGGAQEHALRGRTPGGGRSLHR